MRHVAKSRMLPRRVATAQYFRADRFHGDANAMTAMDAGAMFVGAPVSVECYAGTAARRPPQRLCAGTSVTSTSPWSIRQIGGPGRTARPSAKVVDSDSSDAMAYRRGFRSALTSSCSVASLVVISPNQLIIHVGVPAHQDVPKGHDAAAIADAVWLASRPQAAHGCAQERGCQRDGCRAGVPVLAAQCGIRRNESRAPPQTHRASARSLR
jgi:hypothetical protein